MTNEKLTHFIICIMEQEYYGWITNKLLPSHINPRDYFDLLEEAGVLTYRVEGKRYYYQIYYKGNLREITLESLNDLIFENIILNPNAKVTV